jgi:hypothetical protein
MRVVSPPEGNVFAIKAQQTMIADCHTMGCGPQKCDRAMESDE